MGRVYFLTRLSAPPELGIIHRARLAAKTFKNTTLVEHNEEMFLRELRTWLSLDAPNLAWLLKVIRMDGQLFALMPQYKCSLRDMLEGERRLDVEKAKAAIIAAAHCLDKVFSKRHILHLDLKPDNILVDVNYLNEDKEETTFHVGDWGISTLQRQCCTSWPTKEGIPREFATTMAAMGTLPYMAPERLFGVPPTFAADIYSLGMIFFELVFGCLPFNMRSSKPPELQIVEGDYYQAVSTVLSENSISGIKELLLTALHPQPQSRFSSYPKLLRSLKAVGCGRKGLWRLFK